MKEEREPGPFLEHKSEEGRSRRAPEMDDGQREVALGGGGFRTFSRTSHRSRRSSWQMNSKPGFISWSKSLRHLAEKIASLERTDQSYRAAAIEFENKGDLKQAVNKYEQLVALFPRLWG
jgi:hypothetical protein